MPVALTTLSTPMALRKAKSGSSIALVRTSTLCLGVSSDISKVSSNELNSRS